MIYVINFVNSVVNIAIWTDNDLDGAASALALKLIYKHKASNFFIKDTNDHDLVGYIKGWIEQNYDNYDRIFITDLFIPDELVPYVDKPKVVIIDHHKSHIEVINRYKKAALCMQIYTSCAKLIWDKFNKGRQIDNQAIDTLFNIVDDYDSYQLKYSETLKLNAVYHSFNKPRVDKFIERFENGFNEFNIQEQNAIKLYYNKLKDQINSVSYFTGTLKGYKVVSCCAEFAINELAHFSLKKFNADIAFVVMPNTMSVSIRKNKDTCDINLAKLAEILCDGGGHEYAAGGKITDKFLSFTKTLTNV